MQNLINKGITYFGRFTQEQWIWMAVAGVILIYVLYNRKKYIGLFDNAVIMAETSFKYGENKRKLNARSEEHTSELQSRQYLVCRLLLEKKKKYLHPTPNSEDTQ